MSALAKGTFALSCVISAGLVAYVHFEQHNDRTKLHEGVIRDMERQHMRKMQNMQDLQEQINLTEKLRALQESENISEKP